MREASFNEELNLPKGSGLYVRLSKKGEKIKFRIAKTPVYETKHFLGGKEVVPCEKYNSDDPDNTECTFCDQYHALVTSGDDGAKNIKPVTTFYYPILDMNTNQPKIFQFSAKSIHYTIGGYAKEGVDVMGCDWSVERTEEQGNYYKILRLDSKKLTNNQTEQLEIAKKLDLGKGRKESGSVSENIDPDEIQV